MNKRAGLVCIDIGNTAVKVLIQTDPNQTAESSISRWTHSIPLSSQDWAESVLAWVLHVCQDRATLPIDECQWRIASVHRQASEQLRAVIDEAFPNRSIHLISYRDVPIHLKVDCPERVGIDRLLSAHAALSRYPKPLIVVDAGSAVTVDYVNENGCFCGGAIFPGLRLQTEALTLGTDSLPSVDWSVVHSGRIPAKETGEAIALGVFTGVTAAIDRLIDLYQNVNESGLTLGVVLCGGDAVAISQWIEHPHVVVPDLVLKGIADLPTRMPL